MEQAVLVIHQAQVRHKETMVESVEITVVAVAVAVQVELAKQGAADQVLILELVV
jgi:hypothetical protein